MPGSPESSKTITQPAVVGTRPLLKPKPFIKKPYQQGAFDGYCGLYAIVNALRLIATPSDGIGEDFCDEFFIALYRRYATTIADRFRYWFQFKSRLLLVSAKAISRPRPISSKPMPSP